MSYVVESVSTNDAPGLARAMMSAFWEDPHWRILWNDTMTLEDIIADCLERLPWNLARGRELKRHLKVVDTSSGEVVGYSRYILPGNRTGVWLEGKTAVPTAEELLAFEERSKAVLDNGRMRGLNHDLAEEFGDVLEKVEQEILKESGPCFAVDYMTVYPDHKGRGVASLMLQEALRYVDDAGLKAIVMAHPAGMRLYEKQGFQLVRSIDQDDSKYGSTAPNTRTQHWLIREPRMRNASK